MNKILLIVGPTASGKSDIAIELAQVINGEIISADSMQIYKYMDIGTAKITPQEMKGIPHYMINEVDPRDEFSVAMFKEKSVEFINEILRRRKIPIIAGGTGLYINSLVSPWNFTPGEPDEKLRKRLEKLSIDKGNIILHNILERIDPSSAKKIHPNNVRRVIRAIEIYETTGQTKSYWDNKYREEDLLFEPILVGLTLNRDTLYNRIEDRIDIMIESGLIEEVKSLLDNGYDKDLVSMQGLGYKEIVRYIVGEYTYNVAIEILKRDTRHFAKRQLTWFRRDNRIKWFNVDEYEKKSLLIDDILKYLKDKELIT